MQKGLNGIGQFSPDDTLALLVLGELGPVCEKVTARLLLIVLLLGVSRSFPDCLLLLRATLNIKRRALVVVLAGRDFEMLVLAVFQLS
jgi:hypothetical protein